jgi:protein ImuB
VKGSRLACAVVPLFPLAARLRSEPGLKDEAVVVLEGNGNAARVVAAARAARRASVRPGMTLPQARALMPKLVARGRDFESERAAQEALLEAAEGFSPRVEDGGEGVAYFDFQLPPSASPSPPDGRGDSEGSSSGDERAFGMKVLDAISRAGLPSRVGIAGSRLASRVAAGLPDTPAVIPLGGEAAFLAALPLSRLSPQMEIAAALERWGLRTIGDLAKLAEGEVASRLGELGRALHVAARGIDPTPLAPRMPPLSFTEGMDLEWPLLSLEPFLFLAHAALERLTARLEAQALACTRLEVSLKLDPDGHHERAVDLPAPTRDVKTLLTLVRLDLEKTPPGAPVVGFLFAARPDRPRRAQLSLFGPAALSPDRLAATIARLASMLGDDRVRSPRTVDGLRPERFDLAPYAPPPPPDTPPKPRTGRGLLAIRAFRPPLPLEVLLENGGFSRPLSLRSTHAEPSLPELRGAVRAASGPWSLEDGWWSETPADRDYWDVELSEGGLYRIYRDRKDGSWHADGMYD